MTIGTITIEPMKARYNAEVGRLLVHGFRGKFQTLTKMNDDELALFFEKLLDHFPAEPSSQRVVALLEGEVIGTISVKWKDEYGWKREEKLPSWKSFSPLGIWSFYKMLLGLSLLDYKPQVGECYIADLAVHPAHRDKGVGKRLLQWAQHYVHTEPRLEVLSLHVSGQNQRAKQLYERLSFQTRSQKYSLAGYFLFRESQWDYMAKRLK